MNAAPCEDPVEPGSLVLSADGTEWRFSGALMFANAADVLNASRGLPWPSAGRLDMSGLTTADSSALALLLALKRRARADRSKLDIERWPESLASLARVYGVEELLAH